MIKFKSHKKRILLTGHTGFKGAWLTFWLSQYNAKICGISKDILTNRLYLIP